jgi:hypothetical protein
MEVENGKPPSRIRIMHWIWSVGYARFDMDCLPSNCLHSIPWTWLVHLGGWRVWSSETGGMMSSPSMLQDQERGTQSTDSTLEFQLRDPITTCPVHLFRCVVRAAYPTPHIKHPQISKYCTTYSTLLDWTGLDCTVQLLSML